MESGICQQVGRVGSEARPSTGATCGVQCGPSRRPTGRRPGDGLLPKQLGASATPHRGRSRLIGAGAGRGAGAGTGGLVFDPLGKSRTASGWPFKNASGAWNTRNRRKKVMIIMSNTGGGHKASAQALKAGFQQLYGSTFEVDIVDLWTDHTTYPFNQMPGTYSFLVKHAWMYWLVFTLSNPRWLHNTYFTIILLFIHDKVAEMFKQYKPDLVISVHPLMQHIPLKVLNNLFASGATRPIPFTTVITDFTTCHNTWFHKGVTQCFVPTEQAYLQAKRLGLRAGQLTLHGLPIRPAFSKILPSKSSLRKRLDMDKDKPAVLFMGGGEGMGKIEGTVGAIVRQAGALCQMVVVCGRNEHLVKRLSSRTYPDGMNVIVKGFVHNVNEWMGACDLIITKAGPGTIAEALISGLPMLLSGFIPGQEAGNIGFVVDNNVGAFERRPKRIAAIVKDWITCKQGALKEMATRAKALGRPEAVFRIVEDLAALCDAPNCIRQPRMVTSPA
eukprot:evm.model.scf_277.5 EVM.evm.TU.scf_277.5   scf_277:33010-37549(+)